MNVWTKISIPRAPIGAKKHHALILVSQLFVSSLINKHSQIQYRINVLLSNLVHRDDISTFLYFPQPPAPHPDELVDAPTEGRGTEAEAGIDEPKP